MTEREKSYAEMLYQPADPELAADRDVTVGDNFFMNVNGRLMDSGKITIGNNVFIAPDVCIITEEHAMDAAQRAAGLEYTHPVTIGDNVWIGGNSVICPGVHVGSNVVIGVGSVVTKDIPDWSVAAGNPCRVIRRITEADRRRLFRDEEIDDEAWEDIKNRERRSNYAGNWNKSPGVCPSGSEWNGAHPGGVSWKESDLIVLSEG